MTLAAGTVTVNADASRTVSPAGAIAGDLYDGHVAALQAAGQLPTDFSNPYPPVSPDYPEIPVAKQVAALVQSLQGLAAQANGYAVGIYTQMTTKAVVTTTVQGGVHNGLQTLPASFLAGADTIAPTSDHHLPGVIT